MARTFVPLLLAAGLVACQADRAAPPTPQPPPEPPPDVIVPNLRVELGHGACSGPPCPVGVAEALDGGERVTIYDYDLMPLGLPDEQRLLLAQAMLTEPYLVRGEIVRRTGFLGVERPVEVLVVDAVAGPA